MQRVVALVIVCAVLVLSGCSTSTTGEGGVQGATVDAATEPGDAATGLVDAADAPGSVDLTRIGSDVAVGIAPSGPDADTEGLEDAGQPDVDEPTTASWDPGFRRLTEEQYNRTLADLHGAVWHAAYEQSSYDSDGWDMDPTDFYEMFTTQTYGTWVNYRNGYPGDAHTGGPGEPRGGYRRLDQVVHNEHVTTWLGAAMSVVADKYEGWVGHVLIFDACAEQNDAGVTNFETDEEVIDHCVDQFITDFGRRAFRRPLSDDEHAFFRAVYDDSEAAYADVVFDHWAGHGWRARGLANVMAVFTNSPEFLYRVELGDEEGILTAWELASRLSYHFWNTMPDDALFAAAEDGSLLTDAGYAAQVDRLASGVRSRPVLEEFYRDFFRVQDIVDPNNQDGPGSYHGGPGYNEYDGQIGKIVEAMQDELANLGVWFTATEPGTYEAMFRSNLHLLECQYPAHEPESCFGAGPYSEWSLGFDGRDGWDPSTYPEVLPEPERVGLLTRMGLLAHDTVYARPIRRGLYIREALLCETLPPPENCEVVKPPEIDVYMTVREKVEAITEQPGTSCAGCHATFINGFGHALGHFSSKGQYWETERMFTDQQDGDGNYWYFLAPEDAWAPIDAQGQAYFAGGNPTVDGAAELADALADSGQLEWCWSREYFRFAVGRIEWDSDAADIEALADQMVEGMTLEQAFREIAYLPQFRALDKPTPASSEGGAP